jgi:hypothetical protein
MEWGDPTEDDFNNKWLTPQDLLIDLETTYDEEYTRRIWIIDRLKLGHIRAVARSGTSAGVPRSPCLVEPRFWGWHMEDETHFWETGDAHIQTPSTSGYGDWRVFIFLDVRFDPASLNGKINVPVATDREDSLGVPAIAPVLAPPSNKGGRPSKPYWEDAITEMFDRIFHGSFNPTTQAEVEAAMARWILEKHGDNPSEASIRTRAAKIFKVHRKEG